MGEVIKMNIKISIVGPMDIIDKVIYLFDYKKGIDITLNKFPINKVEDTKSIDITELKESDILIFGGPLAHQIFLSRTDNDIANIPSYTINYDGSALYKSLYELSVHHKGETIDYLPFSLDILNVKEVGLSLSDIKINISDFTIIEGDDQLSTDDWVRNHESLYNRGEIRTALTCLASVYDALRLKNVPVTRVVPTTPAIKATLELAYSKINNLSIGRNENAVILVKPSLNDISYPSKLNFYRELLHFRETILDVCEEYDLGFNFNEDHSASIYTDKDFICINTGDFKEFPLEDFLNSTNLKKINMGIGISYGVNNAEKNAHKALKYTKTENSTNAFIVMDNNHITGPLKKGFSSDMNYYDRVIDDTMREVVESTKLGVVTITKIKKLIKHKKENAISSNEIAEQLAITLRSANRITKKLVEKDYAVEIGKEQPVGKGRPRSIYSIKF